MPGPRNTSEALTVVKLGGSVLTDTEAYGRCADSLHRRTCAHTAERLVVVVSAQLGLTDQLLEQARQFCPTPDQAALDLLWSTGELRSVALLTLCLQQRGVETVGLNVHECGLNSVDGVADVGAVSVSTLRLRYYLNRYRIVVVPGFLARGPFDSIVSLGRGASDLTAVLLAAALRADRCELTKDVPGYFTKDPNRYRDAVPLKRLSVEEALRMAAEGCDLVQVAAIKAARAARCALIVRSLDPDEPGTVLYDGGGREAAACE